MEIFITLFFSRFVQTEEQYEQKKQWQNWRSRAAGNGSGGAGGSEGTGPGASVDQQQRDPFEVLGVPRPAENTDPEESLAEVRKAWKKASLKWHPDRNGGSEEAKCRMQEINSAFDACKKVLHKGRGGGSDDSASEEEEEEEDVDSDEERQRVWAELKRQRQAHKRAAKAEERRFARAQEQAQRKTRGGRAPQGTGGKAAKRRQQRANAAAAARNAMNKQQLAEHKHMNKGNGGGAAAVDEHGNTVRTPTCFETSLESTALVIREGLILMFQNRIAQLVRWSEYHGEPEILWGNTLDGAGNTIMHYCAFFGRLEMAMSLVRFLRRAALGRACTLALHALRQRYPLRASLADGCSRSPACPLTDRAPLAPGGLFLRLPFSPPLGLAGCTFGRGLVPLRAGKEQRRQDAVGGRHRRFARRRSRRCLRLGARGGGGGGGGERGRRWRRQQRVHARRAAA